MDIESGIIFPISTGRLNLGRELTSEESSAFGTVIDSGMRDNDGNITSKCSHVFDEYKELVDIKDFLEMAVNKFVSDIYHPKNDISFYITQSWLNVTKKNMFHHRHSHPNSYVSGVLYLSCIDDDRIEFYKFPPANTIKQILEVADGENTIRNSNLVWYKVKYLDIVLFPSFLTHAVPTNKTDKERISLSFNTFIRGNIGSDHYLTEVILQ